jgi:nucleotide-binding universal stress UspA family protein
MIWFAFLDLIAAQICSSPVNTPGNRVARGVFFDPGNGEQGAALRPDPHGATDAVPFRDPEGYDDTVRRVLENSPRRVITVPARLNIKPDDPGHTVLVAYEGSLQAARALRVFQTSGLAGVLPTVVVSVSSDQLEASRNAERASDYLRLHDIKAESRPITTQKSTAPVLLETAAEHKSVLIVMGGYGQPILREFFMGSVTRTLLAESPVPLLLFH